MQPSVVPPAVVVPPGTPSGTVHRLVAPARPAAGSGARRDPVPAPRDGTVVAAAGGPGPGVRSWRRRWLPRRRQPVPSGDHTVLDACPDAVLGVGPDGLVHFVNTAGSRLFGAPAELVAGRAADDLVPDLAAAVQQTRRRLLDGVPADPAGEGLALAALGPGGEQVPVTAWLTPLPGRDHPVLVAVTLRDLRPQQETDDLCLRLDGEARAARAVVHAVLKAVTDRVVVVADPQGRITTVNRATEKLLGYRRDELVGRPAAHLSDPADLAEVAAELGVTGGADPILELARWGLPNRQDWDYLTKDGERRPVSLAVTAIGDREAPLGFVCVASDRTVEWQPAPHRRPGAERLLLDLDDAATRVLRWGVGRSGNRTGA